MGFNLFGGKVKRYAQKSVPVKSNPIDASKKRAITPPPGRVSQPHDINSAVNFGIDKFNIVKPNFIMDTIPLIRSLYKTNGDLGSVLFDLVQLTNTGHDIKFDQSVNPRLAEKMRDHLTARSKQWGWGTSGIDGLVNKFIAQIWVGGALSFEMVADRRLTQVESLPLINPETIRFGLTKAGRYKPYQKSKNVISRDREYIPLNDNTFIYYGLWGDEDTPYGVPPFISALQSLSTQKDMKDNIDHILNQLGLLGYLETRLAKPMQDAGESESKYKQRLESLLIETKKNVMAGFKEGVVVGFDEDHEFEFNSTTKNLNGVDSVYNLNQNSLANGLKAPAAFLGLDQKGGEGQLGIVFTKMLSQLKNVHNILSHALTEVYTLELQLAGYNFKSLDVEFNTSTISDDLKLWQGKEIKQRVLHALWVDRIISSEQYADEMTYKKPHKVIEPPEPGATNDAAGAKKKEEREKDKDKSDRKGRDKNKPQPKRKDTETKPR